MMFSAHRYKPLLPLISLTFQTASPLPTPKFYPYPFLSLKFCTTPSRSHSLTVSYLINNLGFTPQLALKACKDYRLDTSQKPDTVVAFFRSHGFSQSQVSSILRRSPQLLSCKTHKSVLPKFEFLASKGASTSDIVLGVTKNPHFLCASLEQKIIPMYELVRGFFQSDKKTFDVLIYWRSLCGMTELVKQNMNLLRGEGVRDSSIAHLIRMRSFVFHANWLRKSVDEVKELGFDPSKTSFVVALAAKASVPKPNWNAKVDAFKSWGWSEEAIAAAFRRHPDFMLKSEDKINAMMSFWVDKLNWNSLDLVMCPVLFAYSLEKRIMPRAFVVQYLLAKGLMKKNASLFAPFILAENLFLEKYVKKFKEETFQLLNLYQGGKKKIEFSR